MTINIAVIAGLLLLLSACGGSSSVGTGSENPLILDTPADETITGNFRISGVTSTALSGELEATTYNYDSNGRLANIEGTIDGVPSFSLSYSYADSGELLTRVVEITGTENSNVRSYVFNNNRYDGFFSANFPGGATSAVSFIYSGDQISAFEERALASDSTESLTDGTLFETGTYTYSAAGDMIASDNMSIDGTRGAAMTFEINSQGMRTTGISFDIEGNLSRNLAWEYEAAPCVEFPIPLSDHVCVP